ACDKPRCDHKNYPKPRQAFRGFINIATSVQPIVVHCHVLTVHPAGFVEAFTKRVSKAHGALGRPEVDEGDHRQWRLLRTRRERPCGRNSNSFNEITASHYLPRGPGPDIVAGQTCRPEGAGAMAVNVRFGSKADIEARPPDIRFTPKSGHYSAQRQCPLFPRKMG